MAARAIQATLHAQRVSNSETYHFVPHNQLKLILEEKDVVAVLKESGLASHELTGTTKIVMTRAGRIFAILVTIREIQEILRFIESDHLQGDGGLDKALPFRKGALDFLSDEIADRFYDAQWEFCAPIFSPNFQHRVFDQKTRFPYLQSSLEGEGGFGTVYYVKIHPDHHTGNSRDETQQKAEFVRKEIKSGDEMAMKQELRVLSCLTSIRHPNLLELLGSYTIGGSHNFLFPRARTDLNKALLSSDESLLGFSDRTSLFLALPGLASGLQSLHDYVSEDISWIGCHHDIKPANILMMDDRFVLSDFGLSTLKDRSKNSSSGFHPRNDYYTAPECQDYDQGLKKGSVSRKADIWSLGCVLLDILVFISRGPKGVEQFEKSRERVLGGYYETRCYHLGKSPHPEVQKCLLGLHNSDDKTIKSLSDLCSRMLSQDPVDRPIAAEVADTMRYTTLEHMLQLVSHKFENADNPGLDSFELTVERERFKAWASNLSIVWSQVRGNQELPNPHDNRPEAAHNSAVWGISLINETLNTLQAANANVNICIGRLRSGNDAVYGLLDISTRHSIENIVELSLLRLCDEKYHLKDVDSKTSSTAGRIGTFIALKYMYSLVNDSQSNAGTQFQIDRNLVYSFQHWPSAPFPSAKFAARDAVPSDVVIQWLYYDARWVGRVGDTLYARMGALVQFLQTASEQHSFRILRCLGYYHYEPKHAFALVFQYPSVPSPPLSLLTLDNCLIENTINVRPDLGQVFGLVHTLANALHQYHLIGWLHKSISSFHVVFFNSRDTSEKQDVANPYFMGFDHSRPDKPGEYTQGPSDEETRRNYQHPLYKAGKVPYRLEFDYYSFGLLMLEIGMWRPLPVLLKRIKSKEDDAEAYVKSIRKSLVPPLAHRMGKLYQNACLSCFDFEGKVEIMDDEGSEEARDDKIRRFFTGVIEPLSRCYV
ncbi:hypothetical protein PG993_011323 [Apiospora rasikravindrae]|uniref:Protein kinase domain-containing protein n=1 Tax=Apiospora rasikravindrae TaxID=990691 RepID=A0ABR1SDW1_9PEZI